MKITYTDRVRGSAYYAYHLALATWYAAAGPALSPTRFVIFGRGRSGSTALVNLLHQVDGVHCDGEILRHPVAFPRLHVDAMCARAAARSYGCKILSYQLGDVQNVPSGSAFLSSLHEGGYQIIYLKRNNLFRHALSNVHARQFNFHHNVQQGALQHHRMKVDPREILRWMKGSASLEAYERHILADIPHISVTYEDDLEDDTSHQATVDRICEHIGISSNSVQCEYKKLTPKSSLDLLINYDDVQSFLAKTPFAEYVSSGR